MAGIIYGVYRNYNSEDSVYRNWASTNPLPTIDDLGWSVPSGMHFKEWNTSMDGAGTSYSPGDTKNTAEDVYAIWEKTNLFDKLVDSTRLDGALTATANAILAKTGGSSPLVWDMDEGFKSAIESIPGGIEVMTGVGLNGVYRGKDLGTITSANIDSFVAEHEIAEGKFTDLYLGDYFVIQDGTYNAAWMIAGFDLYYGYKKSDTDKIDYHSIIAIPRGPGVTTGRMHSSNSTAGGIANSEINTTLQSIGQTLRSVLGNHEVDQQAYYSNAVDPNDHGPTGINTGVMSYPALMNIFECYNCSTSFDIGVWAGGFCKKLLPVFNFVSPGAFGSGEFWFENAWTDTKFACTRWNGFGLTSANASDTTKWIRPKIAIG